MKIFLSGPVNSQDQLHRFCQIEKFLRDQEYEVLSEFDITHLDTKTDHKAVIELGEKESEDYLIRSWLVTLIHQELVLSGCSILFLINDWSNHHDSLILRIMAKKLGITIYLEKVVETLPEENEDLKKWFERQMGQ